MKKIWEIWTVGKIFAPGGKGASAEPEKKDPRVGRERIRGVHK